MTISPFSEANSISSRSDDSSFDSDFLDLFQLARREKLECSQLQRTFKRLRRGVALGAVLVMFQGSSTALTSAWADGCVDNPTYCVTTVQDTALDAEDKRVTVAGSLRSQVELANASSASSSTIGFADQLFGIVRDPSSGTVTSSTNNYQNPVVITLDSTLEIRTNLAIKAPTDALGSNILTIERGTSVAAGNPLISVNTPSSQTEPLTNGATAQVQIENVTLDSNANPNTGNLNDPKATAGVTIQVNQTEVTTENGSTLVTPEVVLKSTQVLNAVSESGGAAVNTSGDVRVENSTLVGNMAVSSGDGTPSDGGAIKAKGTVTVVSSALNNNSATGDGGAISASTVNVSSAESSSNSQFYGNTAGENGGAINSSGNTVINGATLAENSAGGVKSDSNPDAQPTATLTGGDGGAVNAGGTVQISESQLTTNRAMNGTDPNSLKGNGGAINAVGDVSIANSSANANTAGGNGGVVSSAGAVSVNSTDEQARPALEDVGSQGSRSDISGNFAAGNGGAIAAVGTVEITNSNLIANQAGAAFDGQNVVATTSGGDGGAIYSSTNVTVTNTVIGFNSSTGGSGPGRAEGQGGGIAAVGMVVVQGSVISSNSAYGDGGAVKTETIIIAPDISRTEISSNYSEGDGGAISASTVFVVALPGQAFGLETQINNNVSASSGGAIAAMAEINIYRAELNGNIAAGNGGAINSEGAVLISTSTLANNVAGGFPSDEGGIDTSSSGGNGGAIYTTNSVAILQSQFSSNDSLAAYHPYDPSNPDVAPSETGGKGGAIYSEEDVHVFDESTFDLNYADHSGGAIMASNVFLDGVVLEGNGTNGQGGAIYTQGESSRTSISLSDFSGNTSFGPGGAIYSEGTVHVYDSVFGLRNGGNEEEISEPNSPSNFAIFGQGGAIYAEGAVQIARSVFGGNLSGAGGGAVSTEGTTSVDASLFFLNQALGDGGAIKSNGTVTINNGSLLVANQAGMFGSAGWELFFPNFYPIFGFEEMGGVPQPGGNGGAIYSDDSVIVRGSSIGTLPPIGGPDASAFSNKAICSGYWDQAVWYEDCSYFMEESGQPISLGNGGGIYTAGQVTIEGSQTDYEFDLQSFGFVLKDISFEKSYLTNNFAQNNGGAVYALGGVRVDNAVFGSTPEINPNYNPSREYLNPDFIPERTYFNPNYIPARVEPNPLFGNGEPPFIRNENYISPTLPNPDCTGDFTVIYDGQCFHNFDDDYWSLNGGYRPRFPLTVLNPDFIDMGPEYFENELYSAEEFIYTPAVGEEFVYEPAVGEEFLYELDDPTKDQDNYKFNYLGNHSGRDGGAIYVEGSTLITNSIFSGNTSGDDGGAIYSESALEITDSTFSRNWADDDGGAIKTTPGDGDLLIARTAFTENLSMDDGGAIDISTGEQPHYDDLILSSLFRDNEAFGPGGAIDSSFAILILNTFENNDSPDGHALHLHGGILSGNKLIGTTSSSFQSSLSLCSHSIYTEFNFMTDESCFAEEELVVSNVANVLLSHAQITDPAATLTLPSNYAGTLLEKFKTLSEFYLEAPSESNPAGIVSEFGSFIANELNKDFNLAIRDSAVLWNPGHIQSIFPTSTVTPEVDSPVVDEGTDDQVVVVPPSSNNQDTPILILGPTLSAEELARLAAQRAEQLAAELKRQQEAERVAAERLAKIKADKLARDKARALAAEKRRAQLAALKAKIAATQARGEALKRKPSWINLMKNSSKSNAAKKLVKVPNK
jgi:predicted outer membrane repeat protein